MKRTWHDVSIDKTTIYKEKQKARELKKSSWWKQKLAEGVCHYCGRKFEMDELTMDHIVPIARGGKSNKCNVVVCCLSCNQSKGLDTAVDMIFSKLDGNKK